MNRLTSKKSYSWWWDNHISPKNSKWLAENLEEMDKLVKEILKLIDEEGYPFAKEEEMDHQRRPKLVAHVEGLCGMYRDLANRYANITGELRNGTTKTRHSRRSETGSTSASPSPEQTPSHKFPKPKSGHRTAGFEIFLGSGGISDISRNGSDTSSLLSDSESEREEMEEDIIIDSDEKHQRIIDLENELLELKQKINKYEDGSLGGLGGCTEGENHENLHSKVLDMERELSNAIEKLHISEKDNIRLTEELEKKTQILEISENGNGVRMDANKSSPFPDEETAEVKHAFKEATQTNGKELSGKEWTELVEQIMMLEVEAVNLKCEIEQLREKHTAAMEHCQADISARFAEIADINESHMRDKLHLEAEVADQASVVEQLKASIESFSNAKMTLEKKASEQENAIENLKAELADSTENFTQEKSRLQGEIFHSSEFLLSLKQEIVLLERETKKIQAEKVEISTASAMRAEELNKNLDDLKHQLDILKSEKDELSARDRGLTHDMKARDEQISDMDGHLQRLIVEHVKLAKEADEAQKLSKCMQVQVKELMAEVEQQRIAISDGAENKREAIRQLCFSLEHYRLGYEKLRHVLHVHRRPTSVVAS